MSLSESTVKCRICGKPYVVYSMMVGDQSCCPDCRREARQTTSRPSSPEEIRRRKQYFGGGNP